MRNIQTAVSAQPLKIGHMFMSTYLLGIYLLPPPKIFTIPPETPCIFSCSPFVTSRRKPEGDSDDLQRSATRRRRRLRKLNYKQSICYLCGDQLLSLRFWWKTTSSLQTHFIHIFGKFSDYLQAGVQGLIYTVAKISYSKVHSVWVVMC